MRITNATYPEGKDLGSNRQFTSEVSPLLSIARPMPLGKSWRDTQHAFLFTKDQVRQPAPTKREYDRQHRSDNVDHYRRLEVERNRRYRARLKGAA